MLLGSDRVVDAGPDHLEPCHRQLDATGRPRFFPHRPRQGDTGLLGERAERAPHRLGDLFLGQDTLHVARAVAHDQERDLPARPGRHDPAAQGDRLTYVRAQLADLDRRHASSAGSWGLKNGALSLALLLGGVNAACMNYRPPPRPLSPAASAAAPTQVWSTRAGRPFHRQRGAAGRHALRRRGGSQGLRGGSHQRRGPVVAAPVWNCGGRRARVGRHGLRGQLASRRARLRPRPRHRASASGGRRPARSALRWRSPAVCSSSPRSAATSSAWARKTGRSAGGGGLACRGWRRSRSARAPWSSRPSTRSSGWARPTAW